MDGTDRGMDSELARRGRRRTGAGPERRTSGVLEFAGNAKGHDGIVTCSGDDTRHKAVTEANRESQEEPEATSTRISSVGALETKAEQRGGGKKQREVLGRDDDNSSRRHKA